MNIPLILILVSTLASLLALWKDDLLKEVQSIPDEESADERSARFKTEIKEAKARKLKILGSFFILLTLGVTLKKIIDDKKASDNALHEKEKQQIFERQRYHDDTVAHSNVDKIRRKQIEAYQIQLSAGKSIDDIQKKSAGIIRSLSGVDVAIQRGIKKIDVSAANADAHFNELVRSSDRSLHMLDSNIIASFSFGFRSKKTEEKIALYLTTHGIKEKFINIDEKFPYYAQIQEVLKDVSLEIKFLDNNYKGKMINTTTGKTMKDTNWAGLLYLSNKKAMEFWPYREPKGPNPNLIYSSFSMPPNVFVMSYIPSSKSFFFSCDKLELNIDKRQNKYLSILDIEGAGLLLTLITPEVTDNPNYFFRLDDSYINFTINFSNKKTTENRGDIQPLNFYGNDPFPKFYVDTLKFYK